MKAKKKKPADILFACCGSLYLMRAATPQGTKWIEENVDMSGAVSLGGAIAIEHRCARDIALGAIGDGMTVRGE